MVCMPNLKCVGHNYEFFEHSLCVTVFASKSFKHHEDFIWQDSNEVYLQIANGIYVPM